ncbi:hypothetical protein P3T76_013828 [Phytophthora citrophthora]|uniref:Uncharacterized protein n=1 Tax=Phytophthora citrophthora TaxID=4793 RepID=A0AAD9G2E0_9STRA|nr:hypothetical protein P3T76_013828 [Phytophthora citrophthora]
MTNKQQAELAHEKEVTNESTAVAVQKLQHLSTANEKERKSEASEGKAGIETHQQALAGVKRKRMEMGTDTEQKNKKIKSPTDMDGSDGDGDAGGEEGNPLSTQVAEIASPRYALVCRIYNMLFIL